MKGYTIQVTTTAKTGKARNTLVEVVARDKEEAEARAVRALKAGQSQVFAYTSTVIAEADHAFEIEPKHTNGAPTKDQYAYFRQSVKPRW